MGQRDRTVMRLAVASLILAAVSERPASQIAAAQASKSADAVPTFQVDPTWPKLPNNWVIGDPSSIAVDRHDNVWILHRPRTVPADKKDRVAPPVLEFDTNGKFIQAWGGPSDAYEWPDTEHGIYVDYKDRVWIGGNNPNAQLRLTERSDDMLLKFTTAGKFIQQIGHRDQSGGNKDTKNLKEPADVVVYQKTNEAFVADGYGNRRVIVLDADTGAFKRMWGAFGNMPLDVVPAPAPCTASASRTMDLSTSPTGATAVSRSSTLTGNTSPRCSSTATTSRPRPQRESPSHPTRIRSFCMFQISATDIFS
jgi:hypothetical protein